MDGGNHILSRHIGRKIRTDISLTGLSNTIILVLFLSGTGLFIFLPLNSVIWRIGNAPKILFPRSKEEDESHLPPFYPLLQDLQNYSRLIWTTQR